MTRSWRRRGHTITYDQPEGGAGSRRRWAVAAVSVGCFIAAFGGSVIVVSQYFTNTMTPPEAQIASPVGFGVAPAHANVSALALPHIDTFRLEIEPLPSDISQALASTTGPAARRGELAAQTPTAPEAPLSTVTLPVQASPTVTPSKQVSAAVRQTPTLKLLAPQECDDHLAKGERLLKAGDLASARLFFKRVAEAGDARGALAMARTFDPDAVRALQLYGLEPDQARADLWSARARELSSASALASAR